MLKPKLNSALVFVIVSLMFTSAIYSTSLEISDEDYFFTLVAKVKEHSINVDYLHMAKQHLEEIGINLEIIQRYNLIGEIIAFRDFDLVSIGLSGGIHDPDFTGVYNENGSLNLFGYHTSMDYNETLGTGVNEWYMKKGTLITPPNSNERVQHYWNWEEYLMDKICPMLPNFTPNTYDAYWDTLEGYNISKGILQSWGNMYWESIHQGQLNTDEFVISDYPWSDLNPLFQDDVSSIFISKCVMDPLFYYDSDNTVWPHLAEKYSFLNDTHLRITTRDGIKWQDFDGYVNEEFNAEDVFFTYYCLRYILGDIAPYKWIEKIVLIDDKTIDFYIDGDPSTSENEPYAPIFNDLNRLILPEHYLNQTQLADGITPDIIDESWSTFAINCFGTSLFEIDSFSEGVETVLKTSENSWWLNASITSDQKLDWNRRFGDFSDIINYLRVKVNLYSQTSLNGFIAGSFDYYNFNDLNLFNYQIEGIDGITLQGKLQPYFSFFGYNMRPNRLIIGNPEPCDLDPSITKGLAIRKAISYAINREEINDIVHGEKYTIVNHPIYETMGIWCNPNIIKYDHDLEKAKYYMALAGYDVPESIFNSPENFLWLYIIAGTSYVLVGLILLFVVIIKRKRRSRLK